jgi:diacylglycerol kinase
MDTVNTQYPKYQQRRFKENALCCIAALFCTCVLRYACFLLYPLVVTVLEYLIGCGEVMNNAIRGCYQ